MLKGWIPPESFQKRSASNILLTASFGHLIPNSLLDYFEPLNTLNVHPSLLPKYRGAAPIQWTIINGDQETGVTVQELSRGKFDCGRILGQESIVRRYFLQPSSWEFEIHNVLKTQPIPIGTTERISFKSLEPILSKAGAELLISVLRDLPTAQVSPIITPIRHNDHCLIQNLIRQMRNCKILAAQQQRTKSAKNWPRLTSAPSRLLKL
jgi:methionyl-tRNA formyltransferase